MAATVPIMAAEPVRIKLSDVTIQICWDADRLDLGRVGITPHPSRLCTAAAKRLETITWADGRASLGVVPEIVLNESGIDLERYRYRDSL